jgi:hypothetical protein
MLARCMLATLMSSISSIGFLVSARNSPTSPNSLSLLGVSLKLVVGIMTASGFPMAVRWGPEFILIYNNGGVTRWSAIMTTGGVTCSFVPEI